MLAMDIVKRALGLAADALIAADPGPIACHEDVLRAYMRLAAQLRRGEISQPAYDAADRELTLWTLVAELKRVSREALTERTPARPAASTSSR